MNGLKARFEGFKQRHPDIAAFAVKVSKDNPGLLASVVAWNIITSIVPIIVGLVFLATLALRSPSARANIVQHIHNALQGVLTVHQINHLVAVSLQHQGLLGIVGILGVLWGGSNIGGAISTVFQPVFEVGGRNFFKEKLIDVSMIFVFTALMLVILAATSAGALLGQIFKNLAMPGFIQFVLGYAVSLVSAFLLFAVTYLVFPNVQPPYRFGNVWKGALTGAVLFVVLSTIWPIYTSHAHFTQYGALLGAILLLMAWMYFFALILVVGSEVVAYEAITRANRENRPIGPKPNDSVPQRVGLREDVPGGEAAPASDQPAGRRVS